MKFAVIDIETTGLDAQNDLIVEIGIAEVNFRTNCVSLIFDQIIKEERFSLFYQHSWIFEKKYLNFSQVLSAKNLESYRNDIQDIFNRYFITAYNSDFDFKFLEERGFNFPKKLPDMYLAVKRIFSNEKLYLKNFKFPSVWEYFFNAVLPEKHRAGYDALNGGKILLKLGKEKFFPPHTFSKTFEKIYNKICKNKPFTKPSRKEWYNKPINENEANAYINEKYPLHFAKILQIYKKLKDIDEISIKLYEKIIILDIGSGPLTFAQAIIESILQNSERANQLSFHIISIDISQHSLNIGKEMIDLWKEEHNLNIKMNNYSDSISKDSFITNLKCLINENSDQTVFIGCSAIFSSLVNFPEIEKKIIALIDYFTSLNGLISCNLLCIEPINFKSSLELQEIQKYYSDYYFKEGIETVSINKPQEMKSEIPFILSQCKYIFSNISLHKRIDIRQSVIFQDYKIFIKNFYRFQLFSKSTKFFDKLQFNLYKTNLHRMFKITRKSKKNIKNLLFFQFNSRKGFFFEDERKFVSIPIQTGIICMFFLVEYISKIDAIFPEYVLSSRINPSSLKIFKKFGMQYQKYLLFEKYNIESRKFIKLDIEKYFPTIKKARLEKIFTKMMSLFSYTKDSSLLITSFLKMNSIGLPIQHPLSPFFGNLYLRILDNHIIKTESVLNVVRYMDDYKIASSSSNIELIKATFLEKTGELDLQLNESKFQEYELSVFLQKYNSYIQQFGILNSYFEIILDVIFASIINYIDHFKKNSLKYRKREEIINSITYLLQKNYIKMTPGMKLYIFHFFSFKSRQNKNDSNEHLESFLFDLSKYLSSKHEETYLFNQNFHSRIKILTKTIYKILIDEMRSFSEEVKLIKSIIQLEKQNKTVTDRKTKLKQLRHILQNRDNLDNSLRLIRFCLYRLSIIQVKSLYDRRSYIIKNLQYFRCFNLPLTNIVYFYGSYDHYEIIKKLYFENYTILLNDVFIDVSTRDPRFLYTDELAQILYYLSDGDFKKDVSDDFISWKNKGKTILTNKYPIEKIAFNYFLIIHHKVNEFTPNFWNNVIENSENFLVFKSNILSFAFHKKSPLLFPKKMEKICKKLPLFNIDELKLIKREWFKIKFGISDIDNPFKIDSKLKFENIKDLKDFYLKSDEFLHYD